MLYTMERIVTKYINGAEWPKTIPRSSTHFRPLAKGNVAAIDFGTTSCSVAYCLGRSSKVHLLKLDRISVRVPTNILIDSQGKIVDFGRNARKSYANLSPEDRDNYHYFQQIKMKLHHDRLVHWNYTVKDMNGKEFFLVEVIAMILKYLKEKLLEYEGRGIAGKQRATDFDWVITVPAIWKARGKQMMREAAYKAGLTSDDDATVITNLTLVQRQGGPGVLTNVPSPVQNVQNAHLLSLALEPEVAALHCKKVAKDAKVPCSDSKCYMVVDIGGGTVDITAHKVNHNGTIDVILPPTGNDWGGTRVNAEFKKFLGKLVDDPEFSRFFPSDDPIALAENSAALDEIVNETFEDHKQDYGERGMADPSRKVVIKLPFDFLETYNTKLKEGTRKLNDVRVTFSGGKLHISYEKMEDFFSPAVKGIKKCIKKCLGKLSDTIDCVFLVGGFGGCKYLHKQIETEIGDHFKETGVVCKVFRTDDHEIAVVQGAIAFRKSPIIHSRIADATYGIECSCTFDPKLHDSKYSFFDDDRLLMCNYIFSPIVERNDKLHADMLLQLTFVPVMHSQNRMTIDIYTSRKCNIKYTRNYDATSQSDVKKIGTLTVKMPIADGDKNRRVKVTADFTQTEIQIQAYDITSGDKVSTIIDFLTETEEVSARQFETLEDSSDSEQEELETLVKGLSLK